MKCYDCFVVLAFREKNHYLTIPSIRTIKETWNNNFYLFPIGFVTVLATCGFVFIDAFESEKESIFCHVFYYDCLEEKWNINFYILCNFQHFYKRDYGLAIIVALFCPVLYWCCVKWSRNNGMVFVFRNFAEWFGVYWLFFFCYILKILKQSIL